HWEFRGFGAIGFDRHLYAPLLYADRRVIEITPVPLNTGERRFVEDLKNFHEANADFFDKKELYLLRNLSKGRGIGFFEAGNFHPDFIMWLNESDRQRVTFVDPKGIRNLGVTDPKIQFHETIKDIETRLGDPNISLDSFIISNTPSHVMKKLWSIDKPAMQERHILFQEEDRASYVNQMLRN
ncbi:MAG: DEAD/DEAH box helicase, partial [Actinobacteria bacterium]|nr:DEAD/DEAH box helicase [Actinomycetota bacterium]